MAANKREERVIQVSMHQMVALLRDPSFQSELNLKYDAETPLGFGLQIKFYHGVTFTSWGERITIELRPINEGAVSVTITSECVVPTQIVDWGKNKQNLDAIFNYIFNNLGRFANMQPMAATFQHSAPAPAPVPAPGMKFCHKCGNRLDAAAMFCSACGAKQG